MGSIKINKDVCKGCGLCIMYCPKKQFARSGELNARGILVVAFKDDGQCTGCRMCALMCPDCAIEVYK